MESVFIEESLTDIQTSPVDCLGKILKRICRAVGCEFGVILTFDKQRNQLALDVVHGYSPEVIRRYRSERLAFTIVPPQQAVSTDAFLRARDTGQAKPVLVRGDSPLTHPLEPVEWVLGFPIASMGEWVGVFTLESLKDDVLEKLVEADGIKLLSVFSNLISMALAFRQSLVFGFDEFIEENQFTDIETLSAQALSWVFEKFKVNSCAVYFATYEKGQSFVTCTGAFINKKFEANVGDVRYEIGEGFAGWVADTQHSLILTEVDNEESVELRNYEKQGFRRPHRARKLASKNQELDNFKSYMGVPITDSQETVGVLEIIDQEREYAFSDEGLLEMIARRIAIEYKRISKTQRRDSLFEISKFGTGDRETVIEDVMTTAMKAAAATHGLFMYKEGDGSFKPLSVIGHNLSASDIPLVPSNEENLITWVMRELKEVNSPDSKKEGVRPRDDIPPTDWANSFKPEGFIPENIRSLLMVPVYLGTNQKKSAAKTQGADTPKESEAADGEIEALGVLVLMSTKPSAFQQDEVVVTVLAQIVSYHIWANKKITELESKKSEISELRQLMPQYEHATIAAAVTAGTMHTVRNHVNNITESLDKLLALDVIRGDPDLRKLADTVKKPFDELSALYGRLFASVFGAFNPVFESCDMAALIQEVRDYMDPTFRKRGINFKSFVKDARLPVVKTDSILMKVVFINILKNAIDANARNIIVRGKRVVGYLEKPVLELAFEDDGIGIPKMTKVDASGSAVLDDAGNPILNWDAIFKPFETAHKKGGTGLGLAVNREIMNKHKGEIKVVSSTVDGSKHGTVIAVTLPL